jgi:hypothetical protein
MDTGSVCYTRHEMEIHGDLPAAGEDFCLGFLRPALSRGTGLVMRTRGHPKGCPYEMRQ